jgi:glycosyltransferase involved in cell wall biosynthesis
MPGKVLVFGEYGTLNGGENSLLTVLPALNRRQWRFTAAVPANSAFATELKQLGIANLAIELVDQRGVRRDQDSIRESIHGLLQEIQPDLVHCNSLSTSRLVGPVANQLRIPSVGYLRDILKLSKTAIRDINQVDRLVAVSQATRDWHARQGLDLAKTQVIYNAVDPARFYPADRQVDLDHLGIRPADHVLLFVGQIGMRKGVDVLLRAFAEVKSMIENVQLLIVGSRHSQKHEAIEFEKLALEFSRSVSCARSAVHWLGRREDVRLLMNRADLLIHPARQEPLGRVLLESLACGLPFIASDVGGTREIVHGINGGERLLCPADDALQMAAKIASLLNDGVRRNDLRSQFRSHALTRFSIEQCASRLDLLYGQLIGGVGDAIGSD